MMADDESPGTGIPDTPQSIEAIAAEFNLGQTPQAPSPQRESAQPAATPVPSTPAPDPVSDPTGFSKWLDSSNKQTADLHTSLQRTQSELAAERAELARAREVQELESFVTKVASNLDGVPEKLVKYAVADRYDTDPAFKAIVDGRHTAPKALERAMEALTPQLRKDFAVRADPQIAEDQKAMNEGTQGSSTRQGSDADDASRKLLQANSAEFELGWQKILRGR